MPEITLETLAADLAKLADIVEDLTAAGARSWRLHGSERNAERWEIASGVAEHIATRLRAALEASKAADAPTPQPTPDRAVAGTPEAEDADVAAARKAVAWLDLETHNAVNDALSRLSSRLREAERERDIQTARADHATGMVFDIKTEREALRAQIAPLVERAKTALHCAGGGTYSEFVQQLDRADIIRDLARLALDAEGA